MKLKIKRDQKKGMMGMGKVNFMLECSAVLTEEEGEAMRKYKMGDTVLYEKLEMADRGSGLLGVASRLAFHAMNIKVTVDDLYNGKHIECKNILEMLAVEEQIREACATFKNVLEACKNFGGEEIIEL